MCLWPFCFRCASSVQLGPELQWSSVWPTGRWPVSSQAPRAPQSDHTAALAVCEGHGAQALLPGTAQPSPGKGHL